MSTDREILVLRPGALGDALLAVPALRALRRRARKLTLAAHAGAARLLASVGEVDVGLAFDDPRVGWVFGVGQVPSPAPDVVAWLDAGVRLAVRPLVRAPSRPADERLHCAQHLLDSVGARLPDERPLDLTPQFAEEVLVHPGSGSPRKNWPPERFAAVIRGLSMPARLVVGEADTAAAQAVEVQLGRRVPRLEQPALDDLAARLAGCRAYLGNDSGVSHLAGFVGARAVVLFGPTRAAVWHPLGPHVRVLDFRTKPQAVADALTG